MRTRSCPGSQWGSRARRACVGERPRGARGEAWTPGLRSKLPRHRLAAARLYTASLNVPKWRFTQHILTSLVC